MPRGPKSPDSVIQMWDQVLESFLDEKDTGTGDVHVDLEKALDRFKQLHGDLAITSHKLPSEVFEKLRELYIATGWHDVVLHRGARFGDHSRIEFHRE